ADLGADVVQIEPPQGDAARRIGPFPNDVMDPEKSLYFISYNAGKRGITLDVRNPIGRALLLRLASRADLLIETFPPGTLDRSQFNPRLVDVSMQAALLWALANAPAFWATNRTPPARGGSRITGRSMTGARMRAIYACKDGYINFIIYGGKAGRRSNQALVDWMAEHGLATN